MKEVLLEETFEGLARLVKDHSFSMEHAILEHAFILKKLVGKFSPSMRFSIHELTFVL
jgi:hypothetical protein